MFNMFGKTREFIMKEQDVTTVLSVVNSQSIIGSLELRAGNCGWGDTPDMWFVIFHANDKTYGSIMKKLLTIGVIKPEVRPKGQVDLYFERV